MRAIPWLRTREHQALAAFAVVTAALHIYLLRELQHDDAYITFRYAKNIVLGRGFVFNEGQKALGTTSPLFTLLMTVPHALGFDVRWAALFMNAVMLRVGAASLYVMLRRDHHDLALIAFAATCVGGMGLIQTSLLETFTVAGLMLLTIAAWTQERQKLAGVAMGLAFVCRYDAALLPFVLAGASWLRDRRPPWKMLTSAGAVVLPWLVFATAYFGSPMPRTLGAKALLTPFGDYLGHVVARCYQLHGAAIPWPLGLLLSLAGVGLFVHRRNLGAIVLVLIATLHLVTYAAIGPPKTQHWHNFLPMMTLRLTLLAGLFGWVTLPHVQERAGANAERIRQGATGLGMLTCVWFGYQAHDAASKVQDGFWLGRRHRDYVEVAAYVTAHTPPGGVFMASEVGTLGYLTDRSMVGVWGLIVPTNDFPRTQNFGDFVALVAQNQPDVLLLDSPPHGQMLAANSDYELVHVFPWKNPWSTLLVRRPGSGPPVTAPERPAQSAGP